MERPRDEGLQGNERIEEAIALLQQHPTQELLAHALTVIRRRMQAGGQLVVAVEPDLAGGMRLGTLTIPEGGVWWYAFTSFEEQMKGAASVQSTFLAEMDRLFDQAMTVPEIRDPEPLEPHHPAGQNPAGDPETRRRGSRTMSPMLHKIFERTKKRL